jgi:Transglutaminase-like superfamily
MRALSKFLSLDRSERLLLLKTFLLVSLASVTLRLLPFTIVQRLVEIRTVPSGRMYDRHPIERCLWAIGVAGRYVPGTSCLSLALAGRAVLKKQGYPARIHIGVSRDHKCSFAAHAWLESQGRIVIGGDDSALLFAPLGVIGEGNLL